MQLSSQLNVRLRRSALVRRSLTPAGRSSASVAIELNSIGHDAVHVRDLGMQAASDEEMFDRAHAEERVVVSAELLKANLPQLVSALDDGSIVVIEPARIRIRALPLLPSAQTSQPAPPTPPHRSRKCLAWKTPAQAAAGSGFAPTGRDHELSRDADWPERVVPPQATTAADRRAPRSAAARPLQTHQPPHHRRIPRPTADARIA